MALGKNASTLVVHAEHDHASSLDWQSGKGDRRKQKVLKCITSSSSLSCKQRVLRNLLCKSENDSNQEQQALIANLGVRLHLRGKLVVIQKEGDYDNDKAIEVARSSVNPWIKAMFHLPGLRKLKVVLVNGDSTENNRILSTMLESLVEQRRKQRPSSFSLECLTIAAKARRVPTPQQNDVDASLAGHFGSSFLDIDHSWVSHIPHLCPSLRELSMEILPTDPQWPILVTALEQNIHLTRGSWTDCDFGFGFNPHCHAAVRAIQRRNQLVAHLGRTLPPIPLPHWSVVLEQVANSPTPYATKSRRDFLTPLYTLVKYHLNEFVTTKTTVGSELLEDSTRQRQY